MNRNFKLLQEFWIFLAIQNRVRNTDYKQCSGVEKEQRWRSYMRRAQYVCVCVYYKSNNSEPACGALILDYQKDDV